MHDTSRNDRRKSRHHAGIRLLFVIILHDNACQFVIIYIDRCRSLDNR
jgi:hypothetical protein